MNVRATTTTIFFFIWIARSLDHHFGWELHFVVFGPLSPYVVFSWSFSIIFVILLAVSLRSVWSLQNISVLFTFVVLFAWIPLHSSSICSCVSVGSPHLRQVTLLCLPL